MDFIGIFFYTFLTVLCVCIMIVCCYALAEFREIESLLFRFALAFILLTIVCVSGIVVGVCSIYKLPQALGF